MNLFLTCRQCGKGLINIHAMKLDSSKSSMAAQFMLAILKKNMKSLKHLA